MQGKTHVIRAALDQRGKTVFVSLSRFPVTTVSNLVQSVTSQLGLNPKPSSYAAAVPRP